MGDRILGYLTRRDLCGSEYDMHISMEPSLSLIFWEKGKHFSAALELEDECFWVVKDKSQSARASKTGGRFYTLFAISDQSDGCLGDFPLIRQTAHQHLEFFPPKLVIWLLQIRGSGCYDVVCNYQHPTFWQPTDWEHSLYRTSKSAQIIVTTLVV
jgi:hypothetical protein